tara:strand:+ start:1478 stop:2083 length:606 start_codon:yes stop_codon:yes gene_type:complete
MEEKKPNIGFQKDYWSSRWNNNETGWDLGHASPALVEYVEQLTDKNIKILIPGSGNAHEAQYLFKAGFKNIYVLDFAEEPLENLKAVLPQIPDDQLICSDFFHHEGQYDLILEQTFFCAIDPVLRSEYVKHTSQLLKPGGKIAGLLWSVPLNEDHPPFGGNHAEYEELFTPYFNIETMEPAYNSIAPRANRELFVIFRKPE